MHIWKTYICNINIYIYVCINSYTYRIYNDFPGHMKNSLVKLKHMIRQILQVKHDQNLSHDISMDARLLFEPVSSQQSIVSLVKELNPHESTCLKRVSAKIISGDDAT